MFSKIKKIEILRSSDPPNVTGEMIIRTFHVLFTFKPGMFIYKDVFPSVSIRALRHSS